MRYLQLAGAVLLIAGLAVAQGMPGAQAGQNTTPATPSGSQAGQQPAQTTNPGTTTASRPGASASAAHPGFPAGPGMIEGCLSQAGSGYSIRPTEGGGPAFTLQLNPEMAQNLDMKR